MPWDSDDTANAYLDYLAEQAGGFGGAAWSPESHGFGGAPMAPQNWKKLDPAMLRDDQTDKPHTTAANNILPGISAERVIREIKGMLVGDDFLWAAMTLRGILAEIERTEAVTQGQWDTIERIVEKPRNRRQRERRWR